MPQVACIASARPNFMKVKPVLDAIERRGLSADLVHTGQHYDTMMSDVFFDDLGLRRPDVHLGIGSGSHAEQTAAVMVAFEQLVAERGYEAVVVVGDVNPTMACAIVGAKAGLLVAHVEAGLRSRDWDMPEEVNRVVADRLSDLLFAPSPDAVENLRAEGFREDQIHLAGNVMIDTLLANLDRAQDREVWRRFDLDEGGYGVVTLHRPSNVDARSTLEPLVTALGRISETLPLVFSVHPRTRKLLDELDMPATIRFSEPLGYLDFLCLQSGATVVLTDSGGIQEETTVLGVPCLTLRDNTERPITISEGTNQLVGTNPDVVAKTALKVISEGVELRRPDLWDGKAAERIADQLAFWIRDSGRLRPTETAG